MASKDITEWHCDRCGFEVALPTNETKHGWYSLSSPHLTYALNISRYSQPERTGTKMHGDICPECLQSMWQWWNQPRRRPALTAPDPVDQETA
jgi:hypothetical protein